MPDRPTPHEPIRPRPTRSDGVGAQPVRINRPTTHHIGEQLRIATVLAHTTPGVGLDLRCHNGDRLKIGYGRLDADLTPCELRCALLAPPRPAIPSLVDTVAAVEIGFGLEHLGGGLYARGRGLIGTERWFVTTLDETHIAPLFTETPFGLPDNVCSVRLAPDTELGVTAVKIDAAPHAICHLDQVAYWALAACLVEELSMSLESGSTR